jgi:hypothetical protein
MKKSAEIRRRDGQRKNKERKWKQIAEEKRKGSTEEKKRWAEKEKKKIEGKCRGKEEYINGQRKEH